MNPMRMMVACAAAMAGKRRAYDGCGQWFFPVSCYEARERGGCAKSARAARSMSSAKAPGKPADIVETAISNGSFNTLVSAVKAAGLVDMLKVSGPFTVFAPTDGAFAALPSGVLENLLRPESKKELVALLSYHIVPGRLTLTDIAGKKVNARSVEGSELSIDATDGVKVDSAKVNKADIEASNGVIHVIDAVIMPKL
jgi:uncharacterized surface protein with fasciclin (FAS1) repeats